jgi:hypothetical protein
VEDGEGLSISEEDAWMMDLSDEELLALIGEEGREEER